MILETCLNTGDVWRKEATEKFILHRANHIRVGQVFRVLDILGLGKLRGVLKRAHHLFTRPDGIAPVDRALNAYDRV